VTPFAACALDHGFSDALVGLARHLEVHRIAGPVDYDEFRFQFLCAGQNGASLRAGTFCL